MKRDSTVYVVLFTFFVCAFFVALLAVANELTKDRVEANRRFAAQSAVLDALGIGYAARTDAETIYAERLSVSGEGSDRYYSTAIDGERHLAALVSGPGLWGTIEIMLAMDMDSSRLDGIQVLSQNETPGLGGRIDEQWFKRQFRGELIGPEGISITSGAEAAGTGDADPENSRLDGITGASRTSQAMEAIVNSGIAKLRKLPGGVQ
ncbi:MAG: FMN-binding protein [Spirochaetes bacterium]|nr:FMN-binding protein [Spirochaetota bacterium]